MNTQLLIYKNKTNLTSFFFFYIGLNTGLFIFRNIFPVLSLFYTFSVVWLSFYSLYICLITRCCLTVFPFRLKLLALAISLTFSLIFGFEFFFRNLIALASQILMCFIFLRKPSFNEVKNFIFGFKIVLLVNYIFALIQLVIIKLYGINIFYLLGYYLGLYEDIASAKTNISRITGLIWDPYVLGMFCALGFFLFKNKWIKLLTLVLLYFSFSRAGQVGFFAGLFCYVFPYVKKMMKKDSTILPALTLCFVIFLCLLPKIIDFLDFDRGFSRESQGWRRVEYIIKVPEIWKNDSTPMLAVFGGAPFYSGARYVYTPVESLTKETSSDEYWIVETDWFGILIGRGIFGFFAYISLFVYILLQKNIATLNKAIAFTVFVGGIGYYYDSAIFSCFMVYFAGSTKNLNLYL